MRRLLLLAIACAACGDSSESGPNPALRGACDAADRVGRFEVAHEPLYTAVSGSASLGTIPATIPEEVIAGGGCRLLRRVNPFCDPACGPDDVCDFDGTCIPFPAKQDLGTVTVEGLAGEVSMQPTTSNDYYHTSLPHPGFEPGSEIRLVASGGELDGFTLYGTGVDPLELPAGAETWTIARGSATAITWTAPVTQLEADDGAHVTISINVDQHGVSPVTLICEVGDTGSFTIESSFIDALLDEGVSGLPQGHIHRRTADSVTIAPGCVDLLVFSHRTADVTIAAP
jgi:hypothetical protein